MKTKKIIYGLTFLFCVVLLLLYACRFFTPQSIAGSLQIKFAGVTNESGHILLTVTNCSRWQITYWPRLEVKESGSWPPYPTNVAFDDLATPRVLGAKTSESIVIQKPDADEWRLWIDYYAETERNQRVQKVKFFFERIGLGSIGYKIEDDYMGYLILP